MQYDTVFAADPGATGDMFLVSACVTEPDETRDLDVPGPGDGDGIGKTKSDTDSATTGPNNKPKEAGTIIDAPTITGNLESPEKTPHFDFGPGDRTKFNESLKALDDAKAEFSKNGVRAPSDESRRHWNSFTAACLNSTSQGAKIEEVLTKETLIDTLDLYTQYRDFLMGSGRPGSLRAMAKIGVPLAYMFRDAGAEYVSDALLDDLVGVQLRICLRAPEQWHPKRLLAGST